MVKDIVKSRWVAGRGAAVAPEQRDRPDRPRPRDAVHGSFSPMPLERVIGDDERKLVPDTSISPWRQICHLDIEAADGRPFVGTAFLISRRVLVTAGHCVYMHKHGGWVGGIRVTPGLDGNQAPSGSVVATQFRTTPAFIEAQDVDQDYGVILLDEDLPAELGYFSFASLPDDKLLGATATICGYPLDLPRDGVRGSRQYQHRWKLARVEPTQIYYTIDTSEGQSGSPIWIELGGNSVVIGIHTTGGDTGNSGTRISDDIFDSLASFKNEP